MSKKSQIQEMFKMNTNILYCLWGNFGFASIINDFWRCSKIINVNLRRVTPHFRGFDSKNEQRKREVSLCPKWQQDKKAKFLGNPKAEKLLCNWTSFNKFGPEIWSVVENFCQYFSFLLVLTKLGTFCVLSFKLSISYLMCNCN